MNRSRLSRRLLYLAMTLMFLPPTYAQAQRTQRTQSQRTVKVCGEYTYIDVPQDMTLAQARQEALNRAKIAALAQEFGTSIMQRNVTQMENSASGNGEAQTTIDFQQLSLSEVRGEWVEDIGEPTYSTTYQDGMLIVKVENVCGYARAVERAKVEFQAKILRNGLTDDYESDAFKSDNDMYLKFSTPVSGYVAVYLVDESRTAYCLLPYANDPDGSMAVKNNRDYLFFSRERADYDVPAQIIDEYVLSATAPSVTNDLYIIFSPTEFTKAHDGESGELLPRSLPSAEFQNWLGRTERTDPKMTHIIKTITIKQ